MLLCIVKDPDAKVSEMAAAVGIKERAILRILGELEEAGVIVRERVGRRTHYTVNQGVTLRHPLEEHATVDQLMRAVKPPEHAP